MKRKHEQTAELKEFANMVIQGGRIMIIKEISTQSRTEDGKRPYLFRNSEDYTPQEWRQMLQYLRRNAAAGLLRWEVVKA